MEPFGTNLEQNFRDGSEQKYFFDKNHLLNDCNHCEGKNKNDDKDFLFYKRKVFLNKKNLAIRISFLTNIILQSLGTKIY